MPPFLTSLAAKRVGIAVLVIVASAATGWTVHKVDQATLEAVQLGYAKAETKAVKLAQAAQQREDKTAEAHAVAEAYAQQHIIVQTNTVKERIPVYVKDTAHCITYGLVRVLNAAAFGRDPAAEPAAPGQPDDACAPISWRAFAADIADDYGTGRANAEQLTQLEASVRDIHTAALPQ